MAAQSGSFFDRYWRESRQNRYGVFLTAYVLIVVLLLGGLNYLADRFNKSVDATQNQRFTLAEQTRKLAAELPAEVRLRYFDESANFAQARDLLSRYNDLSPRLTVDYVDIDQKPAEARAVGVTSKGEIVLSMGNRLERANSLSEEEITRALVRLVREGARRACVLQGSGEADLENREGPGFANLNVLLQASSYELAPVNLMNAAQIDPGCTMILIAGPKSDYPTPVVQEIKRYVEGGGAALVMLDPPGEVRGLRTGANEELALLLRSWGVTFQNNWLLEPNTLGAAVFGPLTLLLNEYNPHPITSTLGDGYTVFPEAQAIAIAEDAGSRVQPLFSSSANAYAAPDLKALEGEVELAKLTRGPFLLAAAGNTPAPAQAEAAQGEAASIATPKAGRFVAIGSSRWATNTAVGRYENRNLLVNMINWLASDEDLISIPPKPPSEATLVLSPTQLRIVNITAMALIPLFVVALGGFVWLRRR